MNVPGKNIRSVLSMLCCLAVVASAGCGNGSPGTKRPVAVKGVVDLRDWDFTMDGAVKLDGEWEFYWGRLLSPSDFAITGNQGDGGFISVPGLWKDHAVNGHRLPGKGYATYRLKIISSRDSRIKALILRRVLSGYKLWLNGKLADEKGTKDRPIKTREDYIFVHNKRISSLTLDEGENEIILQVSNHDYGSGGIGRPVKLDDGEATGRGEFLTYTINMIVIGLLLFGSFYNIVSYFFRRNDAAPLYIGFTCLVWAVNTFNIQSPVLPGGYSYPGNPFFINYSTVIIGGTLCMMIIKSLFPDDFSTLVLRSIQVLALALIVPLFFVGFRKAEMIIDVYFMFTIFFVLYSLYVFIITIRKRRDDAVLFFAGFLPLFAAGVNNVLYAMWIIDTGNAVHYGMVILCFMTTMVVARRFSRALWKVEELSKDLAEKNISLRKIDRMKDQFLASTSHELRTPLHGMIGLSESMIENDAGKLPPEAIENLSLIASSGHRLANMVNDILDMAKIQEEGLNLNLGPVNLHALSELVVKLSLPLAAGKPLEIINSIPPDLPAAHADEDRVRQVLCNLVGNAVKFTSRGKVELSARLIGRGDEDPGTMIEVSVSDTGIGVPEEYKEKIFEAYRQVDGSDTRSYAGTGLGLAIARQIVKLHNGTIGVASGGKGGSIFAFTLPVSTNQAADASEPVIIEGMDDAPPGNEAANLSMIPGEMNNGSLAGNPVILVVDDDPVCARVIRNYFESKQCVVKTAPDGILALDIIEGDDSIDLVLLDIMMPVMSGFDVCRRIREKWTPEDLPVIMLTAKNMMADINAAFEAGANDYIVKPIRVRELKARVGTMLKVRSIRKSAAEGITIRGRERAYSLRFSEIIYITSHSKNSVVHAIGGDIEVPALIKDIIDRLPPDLFARIHKSHIINIQYIHSLSHVVSGRYRVRLRDDDETELPVGAAFLDSLRKKM